MSVECPRCGEPAGSSRWCTTCGRDLEPGAPALPTPESIEAARREAAWLQAHPEVASAEGERGEALRQAEAEQRKAEYARRYVGHAVAQDPSGPARAARWALIACVVVGVPMLAVEALHLSVLGDVSDESFATSEKLEDSDLRLGIVYLVQLAVFVTTVVTFIVWLHRVCSNLKPLGAYQVRFGAGWAIGSWFVPILNLFRPKQIVNDAWRASDPGLPVWMHQREWETAPVPAIFHVWWAAFLIEGFLERAATRTYDNATVDAERTATILALCSSVLWIASALLAIVVVDRITARQRERAAARERSVDPALAQPQPVGT